MRAIDLTGKRRGRLKVLRLASKSIGNKRRRWLCKCRCGVVLEVDVLCLIRPKGTRSCGCLQRELASRARSTHRSWHTALHGIWCSMKARCYNKNRNSFARYGGRGITVCARWRESFSAFKKDVGKRPSPAHSLDRYPNRHGNYEPGNVRWATRIEQRRNTDDNKLITVGRETRLLSEWYDTYNTHNLARGTVRRRIIKMGWDIKKALTTPLLRTQIAKKTTET